MAQDRNRVPLGVPRSNTNASIQALNERIVGLENRLEEDERIVYEQPDWTPPEDVEGTLTDRQNLLLEVSGSYLGVVVAVGNGPVVVELQNGPTVPAANFASADLMVGDLVCLSLMSGSTMDFIIDGVNLAT